MKITKNNIINDPSFITFSSTPSPPSTSQTEDLNEMTYWQDYPAGYMHDFETPWYCYYGQTTDGFVGV